MDVPPDVVERIRASNDAWHRRDVEAAVAPYADDVEWDTTDAYPDGRVLRGTPAVRAEFEEVLARWGRDAHRLDIEEMLAVEGSATVLVSYRMRGRSPSGVPVDAHWAHAFEFRDGQIARARNFTSLDDAVQAVGAPLSVIWHR